MKRSLSILLMAASLLTLNSCGVNHALVLNQNQINTQVHLAKNNYKIVGRVNGNAEVNYVLIFGGMNRQELYKQAYEKMTSSANLQSGSRALINVLTEEHIGGVPPFYYTRTVTVSADLLEFTE